MDAWIEVIRTVGPVGAPYVLFGWLYIKGFLATGRELRQLERERAELKRELAFWRDLAWSTSRIADQVVGALPPRDQT